MLSYKTIGQEATAEQIIEKSRFICHIKPVGSKEEAEVFISTIRGNYRDAAHNVPAYVIGAQSEQQWASDDGEPSGTSGGPMLNLLLKEGLTNVAVVVTRYFGGIKLGTGGLVRAYSSTLKLALAAAGVLRYREVAVFSATMAYTAYGKFQNKIESLDLEVKNVSFDEEVTVRIAIPPEKLLEIRQFLLDLTSGTCRFSSETREMARVIEAG